MAFNGKIEKKQDNGLEKEIFLVEFTNGTIEQLKELANFLKDEGITLPSSEEGRLETVIRTGIAWLERLKENKKKETEHHV